MLTIGIFYPKESIVVNVEQESSTPSRGGEVSKMEKKRYIVPIFVILIILIVVSALKRRSQIDESLTPLSKLGQQYHMLYRVCDEICKVTLGYYYTGYISNIHTIKTESGIFRGGKDGVFITNSTDQLFCLCHMKHNLDVESVIFLNKTEILR